MALIGRSRPPSIIFRDLRRTLVHVTRTLGLLAAAVSTLLVTACGGTAAPPSSAPPSSSAAVSVEHNEADIAFVQGMIPHHEQAVAMSRLAALRATSPQIKDLAATIEEAQAPEIEQMRGFLGAWSTAEDGSMGGMHHDGAGMPGMVSHQQMGGLSEASGATFDRMFLELMMGHHEGAVEMARTELSAGGNPQAKALAQAIIDTQLAEITQMRDLLKTV
jgi:uncharacterized protein (DUF305 family)